MPNTVLLIAWPVGVYAFLSTIKLLNKTPICSFLRYECEWNLDRM